MKMNARLPLPQALTFGPEGSCTGVAYTLLSNMWPRGWLSPHSHSSTDLLHVANCPKNMLHENLERTSNIEM